MYTRNRWLIFTLWLEGRSERIHNPTSPRSRSVKSVAGTKLGKTSLSADAFLGAPFGLFILSELCFGNLMKNSKYSAILQAASNVAQDR